MVHKLFNKLIKLYFESITNSLNTTHYNKIMSEESKYINPNFSQSICFFCNQRGEKWTLSSHINEYKDIDNNSFYNSLEWDKISYADYKNKVDGTDKNLVIYGHNMRDDSMFGSLKNILNDDWHNEEENKYVTFVTENDNSIYEVFSVYQVADEDYYITTDFKDNEFNDFIKTIKSRSKFDFDVDVNENDNILTLSTCANNNKYRVVLHAKKIKN